MLTKNEVHLIGRAGKDAETRFTSGGKAITKFSLATGGGKNKQTGKEYETEWHNVESWDSDFAQQVKKGSAVELWGRLHTNKWEKDGKTNYQTVIVANKFAVPEDKPLTPRPVSDEITDSDIPF